jgi:hypothetical protein
VQKVVSETGPHLHEEESVPVPEFPDDDVLLQLTLREPSGSQAGRATLSMISGIEGAP